MTASNGFPSLTTAGQGLFNGPSSLGMIQGQADPDPATRFALRQAIVSQNETVPMWGGLAITAVVAPVSATGPRNVLGQVLSRAATTAAINGFTVFDQAYNMVTDPSNTVPNAGSGQSINYYPLGCRARIAVACDPSLVSGRANPINQQLTWDFGSEMLVPYAPAYPTTTITGAVWSNTSGGETVLTVSTNLTSYLAAGDDIDVVNVLSTGGSGVGFNGTFVVAAVTSTTVTVLQPAATSPGTYSSGGTIAQGGGALPVTLLDVQPQGNMTVQTVGGNIVYNYNGAAAKIQLTGGTVA